jgi:hypothetical protein
MTRLPVELKSRRPVKPLPDICIASGILDGVFTFSDPEPVTLITALTLTVLRPPVIVR